MRKPEDLRGKYVYAYLDGTARKRGAVGLRKAKVVKVKRSKDGLVGLVVRLFDPGSGKYDGRKVALKTNEFDNARHPVGVLWFGKIRPVNEWLAAA